MARKRMNPPATRRRRVVIKGLELQLLHEGKNKKWDTENEPLTKEDIERINKELAVLKSRVFN